MTDRAIRLHAYGPPENLRWEEVTVGEPGRGEVLIRQGAIGLNYVDVYQRTGLYALPNLPAIIGQEGAGTVEKVGAGVTDFQPGDRIAYAGGGAGAYAERRLFPATRAVKLPDHVTFETAAAMMLKGMTAQMLLRRTRPIKSGETVLIHAAAGGVGLILCQWAKHLGARIIGTVGSKTKAELAKQNGCDFPIVYTEGDWVSEVKKITHEKGVPVAYDSVGKATLAGSLECLCPRGMLVSFGQASGAAPPVELSKLAARSLFLTRPSLTHYIETREELLAGAGELFDVMASGAVKSMIDQEFALSEASAAHQALEQRQTTGSTILLP